MTLHTGRSCTLLMAVFALVFISCGKDMQTEPLPENGKGLVMLSLRPEIMVKSEEADQETKNYMFRYVGAGNYGTSQYYRYGSVNWPMEWYFGTYRLEAENCSLADAESSYGRLRYYGSSDFFTVSNGITASASVLCQIANVKVSVNFDNAMSESFEDFRLAVNSVSVTETVEDDGTVSEIEDSLRTLDFTPIYKEGYFNVPESKMRMKYTLYVRNFDAEEYVESASGYFTSAGQTEADEIKAGDALTFNVRYVGQVVVSPDIKFIISGVRNRVENELGLQDYNPGNVTEDNYE